MARPRTNETVSLFPFLAVLVCAMGALILLLLVTTRRIRSQAVANLLNESHIAEPQSAPDETPASSPEPEGPLAEFKPQQIQPTRPMNSLRIGAASPRVVARSPQPLPPPVNPDAKLNVRLATLTREHDDEKTRVSGAVARLSEILQQSQQLRKSIAELERQLADVQSRQQATQSTAIATTATAENLRAEIDQAKHRIQQLRKQSVTRSTQFTFVAVDNADGTTRRPILIECSKAGYRFVQEDLKLKEEDFFGFTAEFNPLMAGVRALVEYWRVQSGLDQNAATRGGFKRPSNNRQDEAAPYVLLIVRPDGAPAYYAARKMLASLRTTFGYELFEAERELHVPASDSKATEQCRQAIAEMMQMRRDVRQQVLAGQSRTGGPRTGGLRTGGPQVEGPHVGGSQGGGSQVGGPRMTRPQGGGPDIDGPGIDGPGIGTDQVKRDGGFRIGSQSGRTREELGDPTTRQTEATDGPNSNPFEGGVATSGDQRTNDNIRTASPPLGSASRPGFNPDSGDGVPRMNPETPGLARDIASSERFNSRFPSGDTNPLQPNRPGANPSRNKSADANPSNLSPSRTDSVPPFETNTEASADDDSTSTANPGPAGTFSPLKRLQPDSTSIANPGSLQTNTDAPSETSPQSPRSNQPQSRLSSMKRVPGKSNPQTFGKDSSPFPSFSKSGPKNDTPQRNAFRQNWGQRRRGSIGFERPIRIRVYRDRIEFDKKVRLSLGGDMSKEELVEQAMSAINHVASAWGDPPDKFYWVPSAEFTLSPGAHGNRVFELLSEPLRRSGIPSKAVLAR